jgi:predicted Zn-dependent protease
LVHSINVEAYVKSRTQSDALVHWTAGVSTLDLYVNPANTQGYSTSLVQTQVAAAIAQWNGKSRMTLRQNSTSSTNQSNLNEIFFTTDPSIFASGSGVVGLTQVYYKNNTGEILEADILINDTFTFSTDPNDVNYLGNVITHEMGHFLGLGHSQVVGSTMFYALARGQNQLDTDDKAGVYTLYPTGDTTKGVITGKLVGGNSLAAVFGAQVQAISLKNGEVAGADLTDIDGTFTISGLSKDDQYFIYNGPVTQIGLPTRYSNARSDFCASSTKYRGSFYQACGSSNEGYPLAVKLASDQVDIGNITIRCGVDVPVDYIGAKASTSSVFDLRDGVNSGVGNAFVGYFSSQDINATGTTDHFKISYSGVDWSTIAATGNLYVELRVLNQNFFSLFKANVAVTRPSGAVAGVAAYTQNADGWLNINTTIRIPINRSLSSDNDFDVTITPANMKFPYFPTSLNAFSLEDYFPAYTTFQDSLYFYLVTASIVKDNGNSTFSLVSFKNQTLSDNSTCPDAVNTYALTTYSANGTTSSSKKRAAGIACGTVDMQGGPGNGPGGFFIGLILSLMVCALTSSIIKQIKSKHYSKIA